ncbi:MAG: YcxB family protein [Vicinamibacteria bacterium]
MTSPAPPAPGTTDGPAEFAVTYEVTPEERVRASRHVIGRHPGMVFTYCMVPTLVLADAALKVSRGRAWGPGGLFPVIIGAALLAAFAVYVEPWLQVRRMRRKYPQIDAPVSMTLDETGLSMSSGLGAGRMIWALVPKVTQSREFIFVYLTKTQAQFVPLRALSREQLDAFWWVLGRWAPHLVRHSRAA